MTYEDDKTEDEDEAPRRSSLIGAHIPSTISELTNNNKRQGKYHGAHASVVNHSTIQLDGEKSANDNSLHFVSFFSVADEVLMKTHLFNNG